jgi:hypothetical protein
MIVPPRWGCSTDPGLVQKDVMTQPTESHRPRFSTACRQAPDMGFLNTGNCGNREAAR